MAAQSSDLPPVPDESYWQSLFEQEEASTPAPLPPWKPERNEATWSSIGSRLDGRFRWADGGRPALEESWQAAQQAYENDETIEAIVTGFNKGGLLVNWHSLPGFIPASQLTNFPHFHIPTERALELKRRQNQLVRLKIIELDPERNRLVFSERAVGVAASERERLMRRIKEGDQLTGQVTNLSEFGAFVDLGGVEGLIHLSELSWRRLLHPSDVVRPGQQVNVLVISINREEERIALSRKRLVNDPWIGVCERYHADDIVNGIVSNVVDFGAFVLLEPELEGLIHVSELAEGSFLHPRDVVQKGSRVATRVLHVDGEQRRLALSLRRLRQ